MSVFSGEDWVEVWAQVCILDRDVATLARLDGDRARLDGDRARLLGDLARFDGDLARLDGDPARFDGDLTRLDGDPARLGGDLGLALPALDRAEPSSRDARRLAARRALPLHFHCARTSADLSGVRVGVGDSGERGDLASFSRTFDEALGARLATFSRTTPALCSRSNRAERARSRAAFESLTSRREATVAVIAHLREGLP